MAAKAVSKGDISRVPGIAGAKDERDETAKRVKKGAAILMADKKEAKTSPPPAIVTEPVTEGTGTGETREFDALAAPAPKESAQKEKGVIAGEAEKGEIRTSTLPEVSLVKAKKESADKKLAQPEVLFGEFNPVEVIEIPDAEYPKEAQEKKLTGTVFIKVLVDTNGTVGKTVIVKSSGHGMLDTSALKAAKKSKFKPNIQGGRKVQSWIGIPPFRFPPKESTKIETIISATSVDLEKMPESIDKLKVKGYFVVGVEPEPIEIAKPKYPESARRKKLAGEVVIKVIVGLKGQVEYAEILKSSGYGILDTAALKAAKKSKFKPVIEKGKKVRTWTTIPFRFAVPKK
jgi:TonB family protein